MKKITIASIIILLIINLIVPKKVFAEYPSVLGNSIEAENLSEMENKISPDLTNTLGDEGKADVHTGSSNGDGSYSISDETKKMSPTITTSGSAAGIVAGIINIFPTVINAIMTGLVISQEPDSSTLKEFTIQDLVFNNFRMFNTNFFEIENSSGDANNTIKRKVTMWYVAIRRLAIVLALCVLIYVGIRMALATLAQEKAEYKRMLIDWLSGFILIFLIHYIIVVAMYTAEGILEFLPVQSENLESVLINGDGSAIVGIEEQVEKSKGWNFVASCVLYWMLVYYQVKFMILYFKRMFSIMLLTVISPIICVLYPIDKIKDKKAQSFKVWLKEIMVNIFIQPFHAMLYVVFISSAAEIAKVAPLMAILFFAALSRGEKIIKNIFSMRNLSSMNSLGTIKLKG